MALDSQALVGVSLTGPRPGLVIGWLVPSWRERWCVEVARLG